MIAYTVSLSFARPEKHETLARTARARQSRSRGLSTRPGPALEIEPDPELELPGGRLLHVRELDPVEMEGIAEEEELEAEAIGSPAVHEAEARDRLPEGASELGTGQAVHVGEAGLAGRELPVLALEVASPGSKEEGAPHGPQDADRGGRQVDEGEAELHVPEEAGVAGEAQVVVAAELHVAAEVEVVGAVAARVEAAQAEREQRRGRAEAQVLPGVRVDRPAAEGAPDGRCIAQVQAPGLARDGPELGEARGLLGHADGGGGGPAVFWGTGEATGGGR